MSFVNIFCFTQFSKGLESAFFPSSLGGKDQEDALSLSLASSIKKAFDSYKEKKGGDVDDDKELEARQVISNDDGILRHVCEYA